MKKILVVLSGGQDSTTCLAMAARMWGPELHTITFDYGQTHARELKAAEHVAKICGVKHSHLVTLGPILQGKSPLTNRSEQLEQYEDFESMDKIIGDRVEKTFVPMRNDLFLTLAANYAAVHEITEIWTGVCQADNANYPDCREDFIDAKQTAINEALGYNGPGNHPGYIQIMTPLMHLSKAQSIQKLMDLGMDAFSLLAWSHTAYDGQYPPIGKDHATILRAQGFVEAGVPDPLVVRAYSEGLLKTLPDTPNYDFIAVQKLLPFIADQRAYLREAGVQL